VSRQRAVIVGTGVAGVNAAAGMRAAGYDGHIVLIGDEPELPYRRPPLSKEILRGDKSMGEIRIKPEQWYSDQAIEILTGTTVTAIDPGSQTVHFADSTSTLRFDRLLLATGGTARVMPGVENVTTLRSAADVPAIQAQLVAGEQVMIIGAGLIGSEIAASARSLGCEVTLLESTSLPLPRLLPPVLGQAYVGLHKDHGTELRTDVTITDISRVGAQTTVSAADGRSWSAAHVILAIGMEPSVELAQRARLAVNNGIVVDFGGQTAAQNIYAAGDVANLPSHAFGRRHRVEHWQHAQNHGTAVGRAMAGEDMSFDEVPWCWSEQYGTNLQVAGWPSSAHDVFIRGSLDERDFSAFFLDGTTLVGAVAIGRPAEIRSARKLIGDKTALDTNLLSDASVDVADTVAS